MTTEIKTQAEADAGLLDAKHGGEEPVAWITVEAFERLRDGNDLGANMMSNRYGPWTIPLFAHPAPTPSGATHGGHGWVYYNPDNGEEYSPQHPIESGECSDAEDIRPATPQEETLYNAYQREFQRAEQAAQALKDRQAENIRKDEAIARLTAERDEARTARDLAEQWLGEYQARAEALQAENTALSEKVITLRSAVGHESERADDAEARASLPTPSGDIQGLIERLRDGRYIGQEGMRAEAAQVLKDRQAENTRKDEAIARLTAERDEAGKALVSLTCDGSEFYVRDGEGFKVDVDACLSYIAERRKSQHETICRAMRRAKAAEAREAELLEALKPFAKAAKVYDDENFLMGKATDDSRLIAGTTVGDSRRARTLLSTHSSKDSLTPEKSDG